MGLVSGFVFSVNRRVLLAVLAVGISVSYTLVAGAAVGGLNEAQTALTSDLADTALIATDPEGGEFSLREIEPTPDVGLAVHETGEATIYTVRAGNWTFDNASRALADRQSHWEPGANVSIGGENRELTPGRPPSGVGSSWLGVTDAVFEQAGGADAGVHRAVYEDPSYGLASRLESQGYDVNEAPATFPFYTQGSLQLVSAITVTVVASAFVVALLTSSIVSLELKAKRASFATLQVYAGKGLVRRLVAGRGLAILAAGHLLGAGVTLGLLFVLQRAGAADLAISTTYLVTALSATFGGGLLGLALPVSRAGRRVQAGELDDQSEPFDLPRPFRLTLTSWKTVVPLAISAMVLAGSLGVIFGAVDMPGQLFGTDDAQVVAQTDANPLRGTASAFLGTHLSRVDGFSASSPEIYAPTTIQGEPVMARGIIWDNLQAMDPIQLERGFPPTESDEAVAGSRLAARLDLDVGEIITVPGAYEPTVHRFEVVGIATAPGLLGDELLVSLDGARELTGVHPGKVNLVRYRTTQEEANATGLARLPKGLEVTQLEVRPSAPVPHQTAAANVNLVNFASEPKDRRLTLRINGQPVADRFVRLDGHTTGNAEIPFRVPNSRSLSLEVNPSRQVSTGEPAYEIDAPDVALNDTTVDVRVSTRSGDPAEGVGVSLGDNTATTNSEGIAELYVSGIGNRTILAEGSKGRAATSVVVVERGDQHRSRLVFEEIDGPRDVEDGTGWPGSAIVTNVGGEAFDGTARISVDGEPRNITETRLLSGERTRITFELDLAAGTHRIGSGSAQITVNVEAGTASDQATDADGNATDASGDRTQDSDSDGGMDDPGRDDSGDDSEGTDSGEPRIHELLRKRAERRQQEGEQVQAMEAFLSDTFENFDAAVTVVTIATVLHAGLIGLVTVRRDIEEHRGNLAVIASVGADRANLRQRAIKEFAIVGAVATVIGVVAGLGLVFLAASQGWITGFGHAMVPRTNLGFALRVAAVSLLVILVSVVISVEQVRGRSIAGLLTRGPARSSRPPLDTLLEDRE